MIHPNSDSTAIPHTNGASSHRQASPGQGEMFALPGAKGGGRESGRTRAKPADGLKAPSRVGKNFVLDTNVLLHDPDCVRHFADNHVCIPIEVLCELDRFKNEQSERGANARAVHRTLADLFATHPEDAARGIPTQGGGSIRLVTCSAGDRRVATARERLGSVLADADAPDHRILLCAQVVGKVNPAPAVLVTKDLNLRLKALALGIPCEEIGRAHV